MTDANITALRLTLGWSGYGIYCELSDILSETCGGVSLDYAALSKRFVPEVSTETLRSIVEDFGLFEIKSDRIVAKISVPDTSESKTKICERAIDSFRNILGGIFPVPKFKSNTRINTVYARYEDLKRIDMTFDDFFTKVKASKFLCEHAKTLAFDWQLKPANFIKIIEGNYGGGSGVDINDPKARKNIDFFDGIDELEGRFI